MIKALIFDWYGVFTDKLLDVCYNEIKSKIDRESLRKVWLSYLDRCVKNDFSYEEFLKMVFREIGIGFDGYEYLIRKHGEIDQKMLDIVLRLRKNHKIALLSDNSDVMIPIIEERIGGFRKYFDVVVLSNVERMVKINGRMFGITLEKLGMKPEECLFVDDRQRNTEVAEKLGIRSILFESPGQLKRELEGFGVQI
ncbi:MAG: HAD family phosphatase [Candidatus Aenigmarchaeota archaeon]|nr:HAD family phosphatase [Candidatus Aenigmarchaeota archaeon]